MHLHVPLSIKVMVSYLLVVGLVVVPVIFFVRTNLPGELHYVVERELERELHILVHRLTAVPASDLPAAAATLVGAIPQRATVIAPDGVVIDDSVLHGSNTPAEPLENHADRPEVKQALAEGYGTSTRTSATTHDTYVYSAMRFPREGPPRGVLRLAVKVQDAERAGARVGVFLQRAGATALSAAVILSFVAALVVSRPLRRIAAASRAFAAGDFGHPIQVHSKDELGDVAQALGDLASRLRGRLAEAGADRTALYALIDELPVGIIFYAPDGSPAAMNGRARELCHLSLAGEVERARRLTEAPLHGAVFERVRRTHIPEELPLDLPWAPDARLRARWLAIAAPNGDSQVALVVLPSPPLDAEAVFHVLRSAATALRRAARTLAPAPLARDCAAVAEQAEARMMAVPLRPEDVEVVELGELCARGLERATGGGDEAPALELTLSAPTTLVIEAAGRSAFAVGQLFAAVAHVTAGVATVRDEVLPTGVRLSARVRAGAWRPEVVREVIACLGGSAGASSEGGETEGWLVVPRA